MRISNGVPRNPNAVGSSELRGAEVFGQLLRGKCKALVGHLARLLLIRIVKRINHESTIDGDGFLLGVVKIDPTAEAARRDLAWLRVHGRRPDHYHLYRLLIETFLGFFVPSPRQLGGQVRQRGLATAEKQEQGCQSQRSDEHGVHRIVLDRRTEFIPFSKHREVVPSAIRNPTTARKSNLVELSDIWAPPTADNQPVQWWPASVRQRREHFAVAAASPGLGVGLVRPLPTETLVGRREVLPPATVGAAESRLTGCWESATERGGSIAGVGLGRAVDSPRARLTGASARPAAKWMDRPESHPER